MHQTLRATSLHTTIIKRTHEVTRAPQPGDIIFTGTPQGAIAGMPKERQVWLTPGDVVVSSIEKLGELRFAQR